MCVCVRSGGLIKRHRSNEAVILGSALQPRVQTILQGECLYKLPTLPVISANMNTKKLLN